jgi:hypothetical protein
VLLLSISTLSSTPWMLRFVLSSFPTVSEGYNYSYSFFYYCLTAIFPWFYPLSIIFFLCLILSGNDTIYCNLFKFIDLLIYNISGVLFSNSISLLNFSTILLTFFSRFWMYFLTPFVYFLIFFEVINHFLKWSFEFFDIWTSHCAWIWLLNCAVLEAWYYFVIHIVCVSLL